VLHWADLQSVHGFCCYDNIARINAKCQRVLVLALCLVTFRVRRSRGEMYISHGRPCVCLSVPRHIPTLLHGPGCNLGEWQGLPRSCAVLGGSAIGARVSLLWQNSANAKCQPVLLLALCLVHRIHRNRQSLQTDNDGINICTLHRLTPHNAYYLLVLLMTAETLCPRPDAVNRFYDAVVVYLLTYCVRHRHYRRHETPECSAKPVTLSS